MPQTARSVVLIVLSVIVVGGTLAAILLGIFSPWDGPPTQGTAAGGDFGQAVLASMSLDAKPCDDFYQYACGRWLEKTTIPADKTSVYRSFTTVTEENALRLRQIVANDTQNPSHPNAIVGRFQRSCVLDHAMGPLNASSPVLSGLRAAFDGLNSGLALAATLGKLRGVRVHPLFVVGVTADLKRPERHAAYLSQSGLGLPVPTAYTANATLAVALRAAYLKLYVGNVRAAMAARLIPEGDAAQMAAMAFDLERNLSRLHKLQVDMRNLSAIYFPTQLSDSPEAVHIERYLSVAGFNATAMNQTIIVTDPAYLKGVGRMMARVDVDAPYRAALRAYLAHHVVMHFASLGTLGKELHEAQFNFSAQLNGVSKMPPRWRICQDLTASSLGDQLGEAFVARHFNSTKRAAAEEMTAQITSSFRKSILSRSWMDEPTRRRALEKLEAIVTKIGHPKKFDDYPGLVITRDGFAQNILNVVAYKVRKEIKKLDTAVDKDEWLIKAFEVNAYYQPTSNEIVFPAGILQPPFFSDSYPDAMNYGSIGMVIGHEISHGFDDQGRKFDKNGRLTDWWSPASTAAFLEKAKCFVEQFSKYKPNGVNMTVNGNLTLGENVADAGGLEVAFDAFKNVGNNSDPDARPQNGALAEKFTNHQLFFVAYAQMWCSKQRPEALRQHLLTRPHSPGRFRVRGPLSQSIAFASAFKCAPGTTYHPADKCKIWR